MPFELTAMMESNPNASGEDAGKLTALKPNGN
jgi:hypothetical protein